MDGLLVVLSAIIPVVNIALVIWTAMDARKRGRSAFGWGVCVFFLGIIGWIIYLASRSGASGSPPANVADELMKFDDLRKRGVITEAQFQAQKERLLQPVPRVGHGRAIVHKMFFGLAVISGLVMFAGIAQCSHWQRMASREGTGLNDVAYPNAGITFGNPELVDQRRRDYTQKAAASKPLALGAVLATVVFIILAAVTEPKKKES